MYFRITMHHRGRLHESLSVSISLTDSPTSGWVFQGVIDSLAPLTLPWWLKGSNVTLHCLLFLQGSPLIY